jgi:hypothetical protein
MRQRDRAALGAVADVVNQQAAPPWPWRDCERQHSRRIGRHLPPWAG